MSITASISGTGARIKPDIALMNTTPFMTLKALVTKGQGTGYQVPLGRKELVFGGFPNLVVDSLTCIKDTDVPIDTDHNGGGSGEEIVFVLDSNQFSICTTHNKSEGIIKSEYDPDIAMVSGVVFSVSLDIFSPINFTYIGFFSFVFTIATALVLSRFEAPVPLEKLTNLTIHTLPDAKGFWVGLKSWPNLWKWAIYIAIVWFSFSAWWEWVLMRG